MRRNRLFVTKRFLVFAVLVRELQTRLHSDDKHTMIARPRMQAVEHSLRKREKANSKLPLRKIGVERVDLLVSCIKQQVEEEIRFTQAC